MCQNQNEDYFELLEAIEDLKAGRVVVKTIEELEEMEIDDEIDETEELK